MVTGKTYILNGVKCSLSYEINDPEEPTEYAPSSIDGTLTEDELYVFNRLNYLISQQLTMIGLSSAAMEIGDMEISDGIVSVSTVGSYRNMKTTVDKDVPISSYDGVTIKSESYVSINADGENSEIKFEYEGKEYIYTYSYDNNSDTEYASLSEDGRDVSDEMDKMDMRL